MTHLPGRIALAFIALLIGGAFAGLLAIATRDFSGAAAAFNQSTLRIAGFTLWQALLSTALSVAPAILVARAISRHPRFPGRALLLRMFAVPLGLPAIVAALGILALYGSAGLIARVTDAIGFAPPPPVYGLAGILLAHVFFNLPLAARLLLEGLEAVPADQWRLAAQLGMGPGATFRLIEWPAMRSVIPGVAALIFMLCVTSFTLVLTLGGGPGATTLEVAIYQSLLFDFEPARAAALTLVQIVITVTALWAMSLLGANTAGDTNLPLSSRRYGEPSAPERLANILVITLAALFVAGPMLAVIASGLQADLVRLAGEATVLRATLASLAFATLAALLCLTLSLSLVTMRQRLEAARRGGRIGLAETLADRGASLVLVVPPIVIGAGWFVLMLALGLDAFAIAPVMVVAVNAVMAMPFAVRILRPAWDSAAQRNDRLCAQLGVSGLSRTRLIDWPAMRRPLAIALAFSMALSLGDLGVIALFGSDSVQTLPYLLYSRMGAYRTADAAGLALFLAILCFALMTLADRLGRQAQ
jgi:thiamine transport system permease protein